MIKNLSSLIIVLLLYSSGSAQKVILQNQFPDIYSISKVLYLDKGYVVAGYRKRTARAGQTAVTYFRPFVAKWNSSMKKVWERRFPESTKLSIKSVLKANDGYYVLGDNGNVKTPGPGVARLTRLSESGIVEWEKLYRYPGHYASEGVDMIVLPKGDLVARIDVYYKKGSIELPHLVRLTQGGIKVWDRAIMGKRFRYYPARMALNSSGKIMLAGTALKAYESLKSGESEGWVRVIDPEKPDKVLAEKFYTDYPSLRFTDAMELETNGWWMLGAASDQGDRSKYYLTLLELDPDLCVVEKKRYDHDSHLFMRSFCWDQNRKQLLIAGQTYSKTKGSHTALYTLGLDWDLRKNKIGGKGNFSQITTGADGKILLVEQSGMMVMR